MIVFSSLLLLATSIDVDLEKYGALLLDKKNYPAAELVFRKLIERNINPLASQKSYESALLAQGKFSVALSWSEKTTKLFPKDLEAHQLLSRAYLGDEKFSSALKESRLAYDMNPKDIVSIRYLAKSLWLSGRREEAYRLLVKSAEDNQSSIFLWQRACLAAVEMSNYERAFDCFAKCVSLKSKRGIASNFADLENLGWQLIKIDPSKDSGYQALLRLCCLDNKPKNALRVLLLANRKFSEQPSTMTALVDTLRQNAPNEQLLTKEWELLLKIGKNFQNNANKLSRYNASLTM